MSDFGVTDDSVAICKGVMLGIAPALRIVDLTHDVPPYSIADGARLLAGTTPYYPADTVFVAVVDPGVGGARRPMVALSGRGQYFVLPDNGLITLVADRDGLRGAREITNPRWLRGGTSATFHGRDVFAPVGAHLARGDDWTEVGPAIADVVRIPLRTARIDEAGITGEVIALDGPFGNVVTNVAAEDFAGLGYTHGDRIPVRIGSLALTLPFVSTFGAVPVGTDLLYIDSRARVALAVNQGDFARRHGIRPPAPILIRRKDGAPTTR
jgi:S-adenosylmethionine hydrolase